MLISGHPLQDPWDELYQIRSYTKPAYSTVNSFVTIMATTKAKYFWEGDNLL